MLKTVHQLIAAVLIAAAVPAQLTAQSVVDARRTISGTVRFEHPVEASILVWAMSAQVSESGRPVPPGKQEIFAASQDAAKVPAPDGKYSIEVPAGHYSVFAFADANENGRWDPGVPEPLGWFAGKPAGWVEIIDVETGPRTDIDFVIRAPQHFPDGIRQEEGGTFCRINGYPVLQLRGDARTRGLAHGKLVAPQIVDFFRYYFLEDKMQSAAGYEGGFAKFLNSHFAYPPEYVTECTSVVEGMRASGADLFIPELNRDFSLTDLYAINGYIETRAMRSSCTQFAAWGDRTDGTDVEGGMVTGRNMDGEIDIRKVTVSHFLLFAVEPDQRQKRFVSMMWPGFVATISGINEKGFYTMENAGLTGPGDVVDRLAPISWTMRESLAKLGADATPASTQAFLDHYDNPAGGVSGPGCIMLFAVPFRGQENPAFVFEGDRFGDAIRVAGEVRPRIRNVLVLSNHHRKYGVMENSPEKVFGEVPAFSSVWRYEAGMHKLESWDRIDRRIGTPEMRELLQTVAHGTTEYAVITRPNQLEFDVAVASMKPEPWDAPYHPWTRFRFEELFAPAPVTKIGD